MPISLGTRVDRYELLARIGAGGMGEVYRARDHALQRDVAIKFLPARFATDPSRLGRFAQEARAASSLNHPNIVTIHETGQFEGLPYIVMELVCGDTIRTLVGRGPLPAKRALDLGAQMADGLAKAHAAGIVHRDLKPENVMVTGDGFVKILDFGLAKLRGGGDGRPGALPPDTSADTTDGGPAASATRQGAVLGTVGYMSPEQASGGTVDFRADQFALGAILYELATGRRAFHRDSAARTLASIIAEDPPPLAELSPAFPAPARWVVERCLAKDPPDRYASTLDIAHELRDIRQHLGETSGSGAGAGRVRPRRFRPWHGVLATIVLVVGVLLGPPVTEVVLERLHLLPLPAERRLAVLPIALSGGGPEDRATCDGLHEYVIARLTELERFQTGLWIIPAAEVRRAGVTQVQQAGRRLGGTLAVAITVLRVEGRLTMSASLADAERGRVLRSVVKNVASAGSLLDETVAAVVSMLDVELDAAGQATLRAGTTSVAEAAVLYVQALPHQPYEQARTALERYDQRESLERAVTLFNAALERDARYALAHAGLGEAYVRLWQLTRTPRFADLAEQHSQRAVAIDPLLPQVWLTLGILHGQTGKFEQALVDFDEAGARAPASADVARERAIVLARMGRVDDAGREYRRSIDLNPGRWSSRSHYAAFLVGQGRLAEAEAEWRRALVQAPDNPRLWSNLGVVLYREDRLAESDDAFERSIRSNPTPSALSNVATRRFHEGRFDEAAEGYEQAAALAPRDYRLWRNLGAALNWSTRGRDRARAAYQRARELAELERALDPQNPTLLAWLADCLAQTGAAAAARSTLAEVAALSPKDPSVMATVAGVYEGLGERDSALRWLGDAFAAGYSRREVDQDPYLARLRADPRYAALGRSEPGADRQSR